MLGNSYSTLNEVELTNAARETLSFMLERLRITHGDDQRLRGVLENFPGTTAVLKQPPSVDSTLSRTLVKKSECVDKEHPINYISTHEPDTDIGMTILPEKAKGHDAPYSSRSETPHNSKLVLAMRMNAVLRSSLNTK